MRICLSNMIGRVNELINYLLNQDRDKLFVIEEYKEKRSLNANNYAWALITQIANKMKLSKEEVYLKLLVDYGQSEMVSVLSDIDVKGFFKYYKKFGESKLNGKMFTHYKVYKGTSEYNTKEMSLFLDGVIQEAEQLDIQTKTPNEIERLKRMWDNE